MEHILIRKAILKLQSVLITGSPLSWLYLYSSLRQLHSQQLQLLRRTISLHNYQDIYWQLCYSVRSQANNIVFMVLTVLLNPGLPERTDKESGRLNEWWTIWDWPRKISEKTMHWRIWDVWVEGYDHHCPWMGKCIGKGNKVWFTLFTLSFSAVLVSIFLFTFFVVLPQVMTKNRKTGAY